MLTVVEYPDRARCARYAVYLHGTADDCALIAEGPTQEIAMDEAIAYVREAMREPKCSTSYWPRPHRADSLLQAAGIGEVVSDRALTPAEYAATYADRAPWPSPKGGYR